MSDKPDDVFERIESALGRWTEEVTAAQEGFSERLARARGKVSDEAAPLTDAAFAGSGEASSQLVALAHALRDWSDAAREATSWNARLESALHALSADFRALRASLHAVTGDSWLDEIPRLRAAQERVAQEVARIEPIAARLSALELAIGATQPASPPTEKDSEAESAIDLDEFMRTGGEPQAPEDADSTLDAFDVDGTGKRLGEILVAAKVITARELEAALTLQASSPFRHLGELLIEQGVASEEVIAHALACQCGLPFMHIEDTELDEAVVRLVPTRLARQHECIALHSDGQQLVLAMSNPLDLIAIEDVELATGLRVDPVAATPSAVRAAIDRVFGPPVR